MSSADRIHELLPWFVAGTLNADEVRAFERHLGTCGPCREEITVLRSLRDEIERHPAAFLADHPTAERLVSAVRGELDDIATQEVRRHLALCATCSLESRWATGDAVARGTEAAQATRPATGSRPWVWALVAASLVFALMLPFTLRDVPSTGGAEVWDTIYIEGATRSGAGLPSHPVAPASRGISFMLDVDLPRAAFPATVAILDAEERVVVSRSGIQPANLADGVYISVTCPRAQCPDGDYTVVVSPSADSGEAPVKTGFRLATTP